MNRAYSMLIQWSDEDQVFVVTLPEFGPYAQTHGSTYAEAAQQGEDALESLIAVYEEEGRPLPKAAKFRSPVPAT